MLEGLVMGKRLIPVMGTNHSLYEISQQVQCQPNQLLWQLPSANYIGAQGISVHLSVSESVLDSESVLHLVLLEQQKYFVFV